MAQRRPLVVTVRPLTARRSVDVDRDRAPWVIRRNTHAAGGRVVWDGAMTGTNHRQPKVCLWDGTAATAHRVVWEALRGPIPARAIIVRLCQNPRCARPRHLALTTRSALWRARGTRPGSSAAPTVRSTL